MDRDPHGVERASIAAYDATARSYVDQIGTEIGAHVEGPLDRALLAAFAEMVGESEDALVADIGCGPGRVAAFLTARRIHTIGVDASRAMLDAARRAHGQIRLAQGLLAELPIATGALAGAVCWYSIIHTPPNQLAAVASELARVLRDGAPVLVAFQAGNGEAVHRRNVAGHAVSLTNYRHDPDVVARALAGADLVIAARAERRAELVHESTPQAFLVARRGDSC